VTRRKWWSSIRWSSQIWWSEKRNLASFYIFGYLLELRIESGDLDQKKNEIWRWNKPKFLPIEKMAICWNFAWTKKACSQFRQPLNLLWCNGVGGIVLTAQGTRSHSSTTKGTTQGIVVSRLSTHPFKYAFFGKKFRVQDLLVEHVFKLSKSSNRSLKCPLLSFFKQQGWSFQDRFPVVPHLLDGAFTNDVLSG
jgi:hypothetical protein